MPRLYLLVVAAVVGAAVLGLEVLAARTMAPALGSGSVAWAALLAVALGSLAVGNLLGGTLADRVRPGSVIVWSLTLAAAVLLLLSRSYGPAMRWAATHSLLLGALVAAAVTQSLPMMLLGMVTPVLVKAGKETVAGSWAGAVLACGSAGGIGGALLIGLTVLPRLGLSKSYLLIAAALLLSLLPGVWKERRRIVAVLMAAVMALAVVLWLAGENRNVIQSRHGQIEIRDVEGGRVLLIDGLPQSALVGDISRWQGLEHGYLLEVGLRLSRRPKTALVIGLGAGLAPRLLEAHGLVCESVEVDPRVAEVARRDFGFGGDVTLSDGRTFLAGTDKRWDLIFLDVCTSERLPFHLFTREALETVRDRLTDGGVLVVQFVGDDGTWSASLEQAVGQVFGGSLMLRSRSDIWPVGPRWLFSARCSMPDAEEFAHPDVPWQVVEVQAKPKILSDDLFAAEPDWARTAAAWRRLYAFQNNSSSAVP
ncbi:MAG TPA: fused MFS/spermidine synthase [Sedimentisphaerales bacterium]|nr:fused MFS/spermidine synthase [Sedimentisphaerales bacterium]